MTNQIHALAVQLNSNPSDVVAFLTCISGYTARGMSIPDAIRAHQNTSETVLNKVAKASNAEQRALVTSAFFA